MNSFEELELWEECRKFRIEVSELIKTFPTHEKYRLIDQLLHSSRSVTADLTEGHGRFHYQENIQFCRQARASLSGSHDHLICAQDEGYADEEQIEALRSINSHCLKLLNGYVLYQKKRKQKVETL